MTAYVALESTIFAHGLPWPENYEIAKQIASTIYKHDGVPVTIAVVDGVIRRGLDGSDLERLCRDGARFVKAGATDLAVHVARRTCAATTVSATCTIAARAGIKVFATGGIGGVHRGDDDDVSNDLPTLAATPIAVVSAGAKAILDLPRTLEHMETLGILVIGYQTDQFSAFYTRESGLRLAHRSDDIRDLAAICKAHWELGGGGVLVANPIPVEAALDKLTIDTAIEEALFDAKAAKISGKALTPFLLAKLAAITGGASIRANRALALHNARVGAELAVALDAA